MQMTVQEIAAACGGRLLRGDPETQVTSVSTDSRHVGPGCALCADPRRAHGCARLSAGRV